VCTVLCSKDHEKGRDTERLKRWERFEGAEELKCDAYPVQFCRVKDSLYMEASKRNAI